MITIESSNPFSPLVTLVLALPSNRCVNSSGCKRSATPKERAAASTKRSRRVKGARAMTRRPETQTEAKRKVVTPPRTGFGTVGCFGRRGVRERKCVQYGGEEEYGRMDVLARKTPEILPRTPKRMRKTQHHLPAPRLAHLVTAITPLFFIRQTQVVSVSESCTGNTT